MEQQSSVFARLNSINVNEHAEEKNGLTFLSWAWAWAEIKKAYPAAYYTIYESRDGWNYFCDGRTCWVKTGVTIEGLEHIEYLPVMDARNRSISLEQVTSFDVNKTIQRSLTKACARHGLGLYIYAGEDLPETERQRCDDCGAYLQSVTGRYGQEITSSQLATLSVEQFGRTLCAACQKKAAAAKKKEQTA